MAVTITVPTHLIGTIAGALADRQESLVREAASITHNAKMSADRDPTDWLAAMLVTSAPEVDAAELARLHGEWAGAWALRNQIAGRLPLDADDLFEMWQTDIRHEMVRRGL